jgi:hypothetical protein
MKLKLLMAVFTVLACAAVAEFNGQENHSAFEAGQKLRAQLSEVRDREAEITIRLEQLDYDLKPENIERHFAGYGSVHPEQLRDTRRKQLQAEKDRLLGQQTELANTRAQLETAIVSADAAVYQQSAGGSATFTPGVNRDLRVFLLSRTLLAVLAVALVAVCIVIAVNRKRRQELV